MGTLPPTKPIEVVDKYSLMMLAYSKRIEYRRITAYEDFEEMGRLRAFSYSYNDTLVDRPKDIILDDIDFSSNSFCYVMYVDGEMALTLRLQHISKENPDGPATEYFGDVVHPLMDQGMTFIIPGRLAINPLIENKSMGLPLMALRLSALARRYFDADSVLSLIRKGHAAYHRRFFGASQVAPLRQFADVTEPLMLFTTPREKQTEIFTRHAFFNAMPHEDKLLFGPIELGKPAPLTILPTACEALGVSGDQLKHVA